MLAPTRSPQPPAEPESAAGSTVVVLAAAAVGIVTVVGGVYVARGFLLPIVLALLLRLVLGPIVRFLKHHGVPEALGAAVVLLGVLGVGAYGVYRLANPAVAWIESGPESVRRLESKLRTLRKPVDQVTQAADRVENLATGNGDKAPAVVIKSTSFRDGIFSHTSGILTSAGMTLVLLFFLLASEDLFLRKLVRVLPRLDDKKLAVEVARRIEANISHYLLSVTMLNACLGMIVTAATWIIGLPNPVLWGAMVAVLSYVPYIGPLTSQIVLGLVGVMTFDSLGRALIAPGIYFAIDVLESNLIAPAVLGRRLELNPVMIFLAVSFWTWLWGIPGALLAVPMLTTLKILCDTLEPLAPIAEFLSE